jgi:hypothetical protein
MTSQNELDLGLAERLDDVEIFLGEKAALAAAKRRGVKLGGDRGVRLSGDARRAGRVSRGTAG